MTRNSTTDWGWLAKALHWVGAAMILILLVHGWWMTHMTPRPERLANYAWHSALGYEPIGPTDPAAVVAMAQPAAGTSRRSPAVGARCRAPVPRRSLRPDVRRLPHGLDGRDDVPRSHDQRLARDRCAAAGYRGGSVGAAVDRGVAHGSRLCACRGRAHPYRCRAASPLCQAQ